GYDSDAKVSLTKVVDAEVIDTELQLTDISDDTSIPPFVKKIKVVDDKSDITISDYQNDTNIPPL
ncbi:31618_t:CDS:1, partial [Racocetra persica]